MLAQDARRELEATEKALAVLGGGSSEVLDDDVADLVVDVIAAVAGTSPDGAAFQRLLPASNSLIATLRPRWLSTAAITRPIPPQE